MNSHTTRASSSGQAADRRYRPGAESWYVSTGRKILHPLTDVGILPQPADIPASGFGIHVMHDQFIGRVLVQVFTATPAHGRRKARVHDCRPTRAGAVVEGHWVAARSRVYDALAAAGCTDVTLMRCGVRAQIPEPDVRPRVELTHRSVFSDGLEALGKHDVRVPGHPQLHGLLVTHHGTGPEAVTYVYAHVDDEHPVWPDGFCTLVDAAESWARHCGLPTPDVGQVRQ